MDIRSWCDIENSVETNGHEFVRVETTDQGAGIAAAAAAIRDAYLVSGELADQIALRGKVAAAAKLRTRLPTSMNIMSGDLGEILGSAYISEELGYSTGPSRLVNKDSLDWAMRGDDFLGVRISTHGVRFAKGEAKSKEIMNQPTVELARKSLDSNNELPAPDSLSQLADRLKASGQTAESEAIDDAQLIDGIREYEVQHFPFFFSSRSAEVLVRGDLLAYAGNIEQHSVELIEPGHQHFIRAAFEEALRLA